MIALLLLKDNLLSITKSSRKFVNSLILFLPFFMEVIAKVPLCHSRDVFGRESGL